MDTCRTIEAISQSIENHKQEAPGTDNGGHTSSETHANAGYSNSQHCCVNVNNGKFRCEQLRLLSAPFPAATPGNAGHISAQFSGLCDKCAAGDTSANDQGNSCAAYQGGFCDD